MRFPEFEGEWENIILNELGDFIGGGTPSSLNVAFWNGDIPWISSSDIYEDNIHKIKISRFISQEAVEKSATKYCSAPVIVIVSRVGVGKVAYSKHSLCTSQDFTNIINIKCNGVFLSYLLSKIMKGKATNTQGTSIKGITSKEIKDIKLFIPQKKEQEKISTFISLIDERISTQNKIIEELKTLIKELREKIFSQHLKFKDHNGNYFSKWKMTKLGDLGGFFSGGTPLTSKKYYFNGDIPFIKSGEINSDYTEQFISEEGFKNSSAKMIEQGDLIYALYGATSGETGISKIKGAINQAILCIRTNLNNVFLLNYLKNKKENILKTYLQGGQGNLSAEIIKSLEVPIPTDQEQLYIADCFSAIDKRMQIEKDILLQYKKQKKFLLENLLI